MAVVLYLNVCTRRGGDTGVCAVSQTPQKLYPTLQWLPPPWWLGAAGPPPPSASFDGKDR
jgi:hypothetical protein